ncbi:DUF7289 family protein [Halobacteriaceae archaeon SHR40]|uniref:DUF7289 family protein n=1 Tax=Halovenus amylolytica TaxID=2500550 RepID=UPI000FE29FD5
MASSKRSVSCDEGRRGQSETVGFVLLFGMVLVTAGILVSFGAAAVSESEESLSADRAEKVMTQMDSEISMVALGRTDSQEIDFDRVPEEQFTIDEESGVINISTVGKTPEVIMHDTNLGAVKFERGNSVVAYQGGGVWRSDGEGSGMISPPEFNYRDQTLTLPLVTVTGEHSLGGGAVVKKAGPSTSYFPNTARSSNFSNPLEDEIVRVKIQSEFHDGWTRYFETRTEGAVEHFPSNQTVAVNLTAAAVQGFNNAAATTTSSDPTTKENGEIVGPTRTNIKAPSVSPDVDDKISECSSGCTDPDSFSGGTYSASTYYSDDDLDIGNNDPVFDTSDNDIEVVVDGTFDIGGNSEMEITGDGQVRFYVKGDVDMQGTPDTGGDPEKLVVLVHSTADEVTFGGNQQFNGYIYAPNSGFEIDGGGGQDKNLYGGVVADTIAAGNGAIVHKKPGFQLEVGEGVNALTFLHISTNPVTISGN